MCKTYTYFLPNFLIGVFVQKYFQEARLLLFLAIPVFIAQSSQTAFGVVDAIMAGRVSPTDLAGVALGASIWLPAIYFGNGFLMTLTPIIAQLNGSGRRSRIAHQVSQSYWLAFFLSILIMIFLYNSNIIINSISSADPELASVATGYLRTIMWGAPGFLFFQVLRNRCEGISNTKPSMIIGILALLVNIPVNYIFIYGKLGAPALGGIGCGVAGAIVYWIMFFLFWIYTSRTPSQRDIQKHSHFCWPQLATLLHQIMLGLPIAMALFFEIFLFSIVSLLIAPLGVIAVAGHQIALNFSSFIFVFPLSISVAAAIRVGHSLGQGSPENAKIAAYTSLLLGFSISLITAMFTVIAREPISLLYNEQIEVVMLASSLMLLAAFYQCPDAIQVVSNGILRGYKDNRPIFFITFISYWICGLPTGYILALTDLLVPRMGPAGFWCGFIIGLTISSLLMILRMRWLQRQPQYTIINHIL